MSSTDPAGGAGAWHEQSAVFGNLYVPPLALSCPSANFCAAVVVGDDSADGSLYMSDNPTGGHGAWHRRVIDPGDYFFRVSCPSADLCVGSDGKRVFSSTAPMTGSWKSLLVNNSGDDNNGVWCDSVSRCLTSDISGTVFVSSDPTGDAAAWLRTNVGDRGLSDVSCPASNLCVASTYRGQMLTTSNPALGQWHVSLTDGVNQLNDISCPGPQLCLAVDNGGNVLFTRNPSGGASAWHAHSIDPVHVGGADYGSGLTAISCPATTLCVALDATGDLISSGRPTRGRSAWKLVRLKGGLDGLDCPTVRRCFAIGYHGYMWTTTHPLGGAGAWQRMVIHASAPYSPRFGLTGIGCFRDKLCVVGDGNGGVLVSNTPARPGSTWRYKPGIGYGGKYAVGWTISCPSTSLCVLSSEWDVYASSDPIAEHWKYQLGTGYASSGAESISLATCASSHLCFAYGGEGLLYTSTNPIGGPHAWQQSTVDLGGYIGSIACTPGATLCAATSGGAILTAHQ